MSNMGSYARSGQGSAGVSKSVKARGGSAVEKSSKPEWRSDDEKAMAASSASTMMSEPETTTRQESLSVVERARHGDVSVDKMVVKPTAQPSVPSNIPGAGPQGVPPAEADQMGAFARRGNADMTQTAVNAQTGLATIGPKVASSVARMGGQVRLAPGQIRAWAHPADPAPQASSQVAPVPPAPPVY